MEDLRASKSMEDRLVAPLIKLAGAHASSIDGGAVMPRNSAPGLGAPP
jgi:hypothetical protein